MKQEISPTTRTKTTTTRTRAESKANGISSSTTPSQLRASSKAKNSLPQPPQTLNLNGNGKGVSPSPNARAKSVPRDANLLNNQRARTKRSLVLCKPKSEEDVAVVASSSSSSQKGPLVNLVRGSIEIEAMKQEISPTTRTTTTRTRAESKASGISSSTTPSRLRASSKAKDSSSPQPLNRNGNGNGIGVSPSPNARAKSVPRDANLLNNQRARTKRPLVLCKPKSEEEVAVAASSSSSSQKGKDYSEEVKGVGRSGNRPEIVEQFARPRRRQQQQQRRLTSHPNSNSNSNKGDEADDLDGKKRRELLLEKLDQNQTLITNLQSEVLELKAELDKAQALNAQLQSHNTKLSEDLAAAQAKIAATLSTTPTPTPTHQRESVDEYQSPRFKDIQKLIATKLEHSKLKNEAINDASPARVLTTSPTKSTTTVVDVQSNVPACHFPPPPPPPPRPRAPGKSALTPMAPAVVESHHSLTKCDRRKNPSGSGNFNKPVVMSAHSSIVGEIQKRSSHLLAIKVDIETKGEFINSLIHKVVDAAYTDIEDVSKFVDWLDNQLSSLADERAVLKHFNWPEKQADAMREAAVEYRGLKLLESEVSSYKDDASIPCGVALKKMAGLLDKSEQSIQKLIKLRNSVMLSYQHFKIPTNWMLDSGIISKIKQSSMMLAKIYMKRVIAELESFQYSERESTQEGLLIQGVHFAYRAHQFAGGLDSETLCAFEEIRQLVPGHLRGSQELLAGIPSS